MLFNQHKTKEQIKTNITINVTEEFKKNIYKEFEKMLDSLSDSETVDVSKIDKNVAFINILDILNYKIQKKTNKKKNDLNLSKIVFPLSYNENTKKYSLVNFKNHNDINEEDLEKYIYNLLLQECRTATKIIALNF